MEMDAEYLNERLLNCMVCFDDTIELIDIFGAQGLELKINFALSKHFWFQLDEIKTKNICIKCWQSIEVFHKFYCEIETLHNKYVWEENKQVQENKFQQTKIKLETTVFEDFFEPSTASEQAINETIRDEAVVGSDIKEECEIRQILDEFDSDSSDMQDIDYDANNEDDSDDDEDEDDDNLETTLPSRKAKISKMVKDKMNKKLGKRGSSSLKEENMEKIYKKSMTEIAQEDQQIREYCKISCEECSEFFQTFVDLKRHSRTYHNTKGFVTCCNRKFTKRLRLREHITKHLNPKAFMCTVCNKSYANTQGLKLHMARHDPPESRPFKCEKCTRTYAKKYQLNAHQILHIADEDKKFNCPECEKAFANVSLLRTHIRSRHEPAQEFICDICAKGFKIKSVFEKHRLEHDESYQAVKIQCTVCGTWLKNASSLRKHMQRHNDAGGLYYCDLCGKQAPNKLALRSHTNFVHLSEKVHKCTLCDKAFKRAFTLREHMTTHTGEVLYNCPFCTKTFNSSANMHAHKKKMHPKEWRETHRNKTTFV